MASASWFLLSRRGLLGHCAPLLTFYYGVYLPGAETVRMRATRRAGWLFVRLACVYHHHTHCALLNAVRDGTFRSESMTLLSADHVIARN